MDESHSCPPPDVWADYRNRVYHTDENQALLEHLQEHLRECASCRNDNRGLLKRPDRSKQWATVATMLFGLIGLGLVLLVSFRTPPHSTPSPTVQPAPTVAPTVLSRVVPATSDPTGE